ncbi:MAG: MltA domain-containing protein [Sphingomonadales bacterium]
MRASRFLLLAAAIAAMAVWLGWTQTPQTPALRPVDASALPGWAADDPQATLHAFITACDRAPWRRLDPALAARLQLTAADWQAACDLAARTPPQAAQGFFETHFQALEWRRGWAPAGFFTGYFLPELQGAPVPHPCCPVPLYRRPPELVSVDLGQFAPDLAGRRLAGRVEDGRLKPYADRAAIDAGALAGRNLELAWVADPVEAFFLHIQGSGQIRFADGTLLRVGFAGHNGHAYHAIGRSLIARGAIAADALTLDSLAAWLRAHPEDAAALMRENASYVFFRTLDGAGAEGSLATTLTAGRSLAVDPLHTPLGLPVWIDTSAGTADSRQTYRRLMLAEDTGGAIKGAGRADIFFGAGPRARALAGHQKHPGRLVVLLPKPAP